MAGRRLAAIAVFLCFCMLLNPCCVSAASTDEAVEPIDVNKECKLDISCCYEETAFSGVSVKLYKVADISADFQYTLSSSFSSYDVVINGIKTNDEWKEICSTLETYIIADGLKEDHSSVTDGFGRVVFEFLETGLYMAMIENAEQDDLKCHFGSSLIALPGLNEGVWQYDVSVKAKPQILPPSTEQEIEYSVIKLWKEDNGGINRPKSIEVEIFREGISFETVTLSEENKWSYSWPAKDDGARWNVIERNVPSGYTMTVVKRDTCFVLTNTIESDSPDTPQTGDSSNVLVYILLMNVSGIVLIIIGKTEKRKRL